MKKVKTFERSRDSGTAVQFSQNSIVTNCTANTYVPIRSTALKFVNFRPSQARLRRRKNRHEDVLAWAKTGSNLI
eukprot:3732559-Rhodomonas_salina.2